MNPTSNPTDRQMSSSATASTSQPTLQPTKSLCAEIRELLSHANNGYNPFFSNGFDKDRIVKLEHCEEDGKKIKISLLVARQRDILPFVTREHLMNRNVELFTEPVTRSEGPKKFIIGDVYQHTFSVEPDYSLKRKV